MQTKLTLRLDDGLIFRAKEYARNAGKSLSQVVAEYFAAIALPAAPTFEPTPAVSRLRGVLKGSRAGNESDYMDYLEKKHR